MEIREGGISQRGVDDISPNAVGDDSRLSPEILLDKLFRPRLLRADEEITGLRSSAHQFALPQARHRGGTDGSVVMPFKDIVAERDKVAGAQQLPAGVEVLEEGVCVNTLPTGVKHSDEHPLKIKNLLK